jgi:hypothetical protein
MSYYLEGRTIRISDADGDFLGAVMSAEDGIAIVAELEALRERAERAEARAWTCENCAAPFNEEDGAYCAECRARSPLELAAPELAEAIAEILSSLDTMTSEDFALGADRILRERLRAALRKAGRA